MMKLDIQMFASTNKTANYELPQFVGTDKPTWLGDFNSAMSAIDTGMATNASDIDSMDTRVSSAEATASQASQNVTTLTGRVNTVESSLTSVTSTANNAQSTATSALNTANTANGKADTNASAISDLESDVSTLQSELEEFNLDTFTTIAKADTTASNINSDYFVDLTLATNSHNKTIFKLYGQVTGKLTTYSTPGYIAFQSSLRPESDITINGCGVTAYESGGNVNALGFPSITILTTGEIRINFKVYGSTNSTRIILTANLYFVKDFGDA